MNTEKKWMVTLDEGTYEWVKSTASELQIHGSDIIKELINKVMGEDSTTFKNQLIEARSRIVRQELEAKKAAIEAQLRALQSAEVNKVGKRARKL